MCETAFKTAIIAYVTITFFSKDPPALNLKQDQEGKILLAGYAFDLWVELSLRCNFTFTVVRSIDGAWGSKQSDGSMNGIIGMIARNEVYVGLTTFGYDVDRLEFADYLLPLGLFGYGCLN